MKKVKVYIGGNIYGAGNIGDDAILYGIKKILEQKNYTYTIGTLNGKSPPGFTNRNTSFINALKLGQVKEALAKTDIFIAGGGTMIGDEIGVFFPVKHMAQLIVMARIYRKKIYLLSIGANQPRKRLTKTIVKRIYGLADFISLRDKESLETCKNLGMPQEKLRLTADPAFLVEAHETKRSKAIKKKITKNNQGVFGVNIVNESWRHFKDYKQNIAIACNYTYKKYGYKPIFFCSEVRKGKFYDYEANIETATYLDCPHYIMKPVYYTPPEMIDIISQFSFVIGMRMHSLIFSSIAGTPFTTISRTDKVDNLMKSFGLRSSGNINNFKSESLIGDIKKIIKSDKSYTESFPIKIAQFKKRARENYEILSALEKIGVDYSAENRRL